MLKYMREGCAVSKGLGAKAELVLGEGEGNSPLSAGAGEKHRE